MTVYLVGAGPGDPSLITVKGSTLLKKADVVVFDRLVDGRLVALASSAEVIDVGKFPGEPRSQQEISDLLVELSHKHEVVVRLKGGDPFLFGRGGEELEVLMKAGVDVVVVPGITSAFAAPAYAGVPLTHRGLSSGVTIVTGQVGETDESVDWDTLAKLDTTLVILMGMAKRAEISGRLIKAGRDASTPVAVIEWGTTPRQRSVKTTLGELESVTLGSPATIVVGAVAGLELEWFVPPPLGNKTIVLTREDPELATAIADNGATVIEMPVTKAVELDSGIAELREGFGRGGYELIAFTSAKAVAPFVRAVGDMRRLAGIRIAAVGPATAEAIRAASIEPDVVPEKASAVDLVAAIGQPCGTARALFCRGSDALKDLPNGLRQRGWSVDEVELYRTEARSDPELAGIASKAEMVVFAAPSAVFAFAAVLDGKLPSCVAICIGETTASAARTFFDRVEVAGSASSKGLLEAVLAVAARQ